MKTSFRNTTLLVLLTLTVAFLSGCEREPSDAVDQDAIYTEYEIFYNQNEDKSYARATFKFSNILGTKLELADGAEVSFNGDVLSWKPALAYYEKEYAGFVNTGTFTYVDLDGNTFQNTATVEEIAYPEGFETLDRSAAFELTWPGSALSDSGDVTVVVNGENEGDAQTFFTSTDGANSIIFGVDKLSQLGEGPGTVYMDRRNYGDHNGTSRGGYVVGRYRPTNATPVIQ